MLGLGLCVASVTAEAADGAPTLLPALPQGTTRPGAGGVLPACGCKPVAWCVLRPVDRECADKRQVVLLPAAQIW